jgi:hypothetical protein
MIWTFLLYGWFNTAALFVLALTPVLCLAAGGF